MIELIWCPIIQLWMFSLKPPHHIIVAKCMQHLHYGAGTRLSDSFWVKNPWLPFPNESMAFEVAELMRAWRGQPNTS